jgi:hypothetical protein
MPLWIPAFAGMSGRGHQKQSSNGFECFAASPRVAILAPAGMLMLLAAGLLFR